MIPTNTRIDSQNRKDIYIETKTLNINSKQDFSCCGSSRDIFGSFNYIIVADGHGKGNYIKQLQSNNFNWKRIVSQPTERKMKKELDKQIENKDYNNDGSTLSIVKIYDSIIKCYWVGDSKINIFKNNKKIFKSKCHHFSEKDQLVSNKIKSTYSLKIRNSKEIDMKKIYRLETKTGKILLKKSLGHNNKLSPEFQTNYIRYNTNIKNKDVLTIIIGSDGFWDMCSFKEDKQILCKGNVNDLINLAYDRWHQKWWYKNKYTTLHKPDIDDISVGIFRC